MSGEPKKLPEILFEIGKVIGSAEHLGALLTSISQLVTQLVGARACSILLLDKDEARLLGRAAYGLERDDVEAIAFRLGEGVAGWVAEHGEPAIIADVTDDPRFVELDDSNHKIRALACVPIRASGHIIGVLTATSPEAAVFDDRDADLLAFVATTMGLDVENHRLRRLALTDALTGAYNREFYQRHLPDTVERCATNQEPLSVAMVDIDHFKQVNDRHGHDVGDTVLTAVAAILRGAVRGDDVLVRYGGEEFLAILPKSDAAAASAIAERMRERLAAAPIEVATTDGTAQLQVRVSIGVAQHRAGETARDLVRRADAALYAAKDSGRDRIWLAD